MNSSPPEAGGRRREKPTREESIDARRLILATAHDTFGSRGYEAATNRAIASGAGITTGTLYHHFELKAVLFAAVYAEAVEAIIDRLTAATGQCTSFIDCIEAILDESHRMTAENSALSRFIGMSYVDLQRTPALGELWRASTEAIGDLVRHLADDAIAAGEIDAADKPAVLALFAVFTVGLTMAASQSAARNRLAVEAVKRLVRGDRFGS